jgi:imidazolonepropionase-like amidohydrolase
MSKKEKSFPNQSVEIKEGKIVRILPEIVEETDMILLDFHGQYLAPGLINLHTHLFGNGVPKKAIANKGKSQAGS